MEENFASHEKLFCRKSKKPGSVSFPDRYSAKGLARCKAFFCPDERSFSILNWYSFGIRTCRLNVSHALYFQKVISLPFTGPKGFGQETCMAFGEEYPAFFDAHSDYRNGLSAVNCSKSAARRCLSALSGCPWLGSFWIGRAHV